MGDRTPGERPATTPARKDTTPTMPEHETEHDVTPARWWQTRPTDDRPDVLVPTHRSDPTKHDDPRLFDHDRYVRTTDGPGDRTLPPGTIALARDTRAYWDGCVVGRVTAVLPVLRLSADDWDRCTTALCHASALPRPALAFARPRVTVTDLHTGAPYDVTPPQEATLDGPPITADPAASYTIRVPPPWGRTRHASTYAVLDRLAGPAPRIGDSLRALMDRPLAGWTIAGPYREDRP